MVYFEYFLVYSLTYFVRGKTLVRNTINVVEYIGLVQHFNAPLIYMTCFFLLPLQFSKKLAPNFFYGAINIILSV